MAQDAAHQYGDFELEEMIVEKWQKRKMRSVEHADNT
jgi:hypothetical protein